MTVVVEDFYVASAAVNVSAASICLGFLEQQEDACPLFVVPCRPFIVCKHDTLLFDPTKVRNLCFVDDDD